MSNNNASGLARKLLLMNDSQRKEFLESKTEEIRNNLIGYIIVLKDLSNDLFNKPPEDVNTLLSQLDADTLEDLACYINNDRHSLRQVNDYFRTHHNDPFKILKIKYI